MHLQYMFFIDKFLFITRISYLFPSWYMLVKPYWKVYGTNAYDMPRSMSTLEAGY